MKEIEMIRDVEFKDVDNIDKLCTKINDKFYTTFLKNKGDGYFFNRSLHIYGSSEKNQFHDFECRTNLILDLFDDILKDKSIVSFGEDCFGNQFVFYSEGIGILMIETGDIEYISFDFETFLTKLYDDKDYYTGEPFMIQFVRKNSKVEFHERLNPKVPFVLGGKYELDNLFLMNYKEILEYNSEIAVQINDMDDGEEVNLRIE